MPVSHRGIAHAWRVWPIGLPGSIPGTGVFILSPSLKNYSLCFWIPSREISFSMILLRLLKTTIPPITNAKIKI